MLETILTIVASTGLFSWLGGKLFGFVKAKTNSRVANALETAIQLSKQLIITSATSTPEATKAALKGVFAIQLAKVGIYEKQRAPFQPAIDRAISTLITEWYQSSASRILPPIAAKVL